MGTYERRVASLSQLIDNPEFSLDYFRSVLSVVVAIKEDVAILKRQFNAFRDTGIILSSDVDFLKSEFLDKVSEFLKK